LEDHGGTGGGEVNFSIIIPSRNENNLMHCLRAIRAHEPHPKIIVIDDGVNWRSGIGPLYCRKKDGDEEYCCPGCFSDPSDGEDCTCDGIIIPGWKPFIFSRNINLGIEAANDDDVIILNDDAILETSGGFTAMAAVSRDHPEYGLIAATTNVTGNLNQVQKGIGLREDPRQVCFICVYIPRTTIDRVGLLDERFVDYGMDDDDYCLRVRKAGLKLGIFDGCFVDHGSLTSSFRGGAESAGDFHPNLRRFIEKWGHDNFGRPCRV